MAFRFASNSLYCLLHLADGLQDFARHVFRGELLEDLLHQGVLPAIPPQPQFIEHLLRVHQPQLLQRGLKFLGDLRVGLEILAGSSATPPPPCCSACTGDRNARSSCGDRDSVGLIWCMRILSSISSESVLVAIRMSHVSCKASTRAYCGVSSVMTCTTFSTPPAGEHGIDPPAPFVEFLQGSRRRADRDDFLPAVVADPVSRLLAARTSRRSPARCRAARRATCRRETKIRRKSSFTKTICLMASPSPAPFCSARPTVSPVRPRRIRPSFSTDFRRRRGCGKQNHKTADDAGRRPVANRAMNASFHASLDSPLPLPHHSLCSIGSAHVKRQGSRHSAAVPSRPANVLDNRPRLTAKWGV